MYESYSRREAAKKALLERNAYISGLLANTNLDDEKSTKRNLLENVDIDYQNRLKSIYNIIEEEIDLESDPFFKAMKIPGKDYIPGEATETETHDQKLDIDIDQGG